MRGGTCRCCRRCACPSSGPTPTRTPRHPRFTGWTPTRLAAARGEPCRCPPGESRVSRCPCRRWATARAGASSATPTGSTPHGRSAARPRRPSPRSSGRAWPARRPHRLARAISVPAGRNTECRWWTPCRGATRRCRRCGRAASPTTNQRTRWLSLRPASAAAGACWPRCVAPRSGPSGRPRPGWRRTPQASTTSAAPPRRRAGAAAPQTSYSLGEFAAIRAAAGRTVRCAVRRIEANTRLLQRWRAGEIASESADWWWGWLLDHIAGGGELPRGTVSTTGTRYFSRPVRRLLGPDGGADALARLYPSYEEMGAAAVLLICHEGWNLSVLPVSYTHLT